MNNVKNLAGNDVSIFLFRFVLRCTGIDFVLNEAIAADMYQDVDEKLKPLAHACCETLLRYRYLSVSDTMMDGNILATGEFEVMLSKGLGSHFAETEKQQLFQDAKTIADLLVAVMDRKTQELKEGVSVQVVETQPLPSRLPRRTLPPWTRTPPYHRTSGTRRHPKCEPILRRSKDRCRP